MGEGLSVSYLDRCVGWLLGGDRSTGQLWIVLDPTSLNANRLNAWLGQQSVTRPGSQQQWLDQQPLFHNSSNTVTDKSLHSQGFKLKVKVRSLSAAYALQGMNQQISVSTYCTAAEFSAEYRGKLPSAEELQARIDSAIVKSHQKYYQSIARIIC